MKSLAYLFCVLVAIWAINCQEDPEGQPEMDMEEMQRQQESMKRTSCLILSRYHSNAHKDLIEEVISTLQGEDQNKYINKMYAMAVQRCMPSISFEEAQMVLCKIKIVL